MRSSQLATRSILGIQTRRFALQSTGPLPNGRQFVSGHDATVLDEPQLQYGFGEAGLDG